MTVGSTKGTGAVLGLARRITLTERGGRYERGSLAVRSRAASFLLLTLAGLGYGLLVAVAPPWLTVASSVLVVLLAVVPQLQKLGAVLLLAGFGAVAAVSDSTVGPTGITEDAGVQFSAPKWLAYSFLGLGALVLLLPAGGARRRLRAPHWLLLAYLVATAVGAAQSPDRVLFVLRWLQIALPFVAALVWWRALGRSYLPAYAVLAAAAFQVGTALFLLALNPAFEGEELLPADPGEQFLRLGGFVHPVLLAFTAACLVAWGLWRFLSRTPRAALLGLAIVPLPAAALWFSRGRTGLLAAVAMMIGLLILRGYQSKEVPGSPNMRRFLLVIIVPLLTVLLFSSLAAWFIRGRPDELKNLTGRTRLWGAALELVFERPLFGWGPGLLRSGEVANELEAEVGFVGHAHNALLEATLAGGVLGGALWLAAFLIMGMMLLRRPVAFDDFGFLEKALWLGLLVWGTVEGNLAGFGFSWLLLLALLVSLPEASAQPAPAQVSSSPVAEQAERRPMRSDHLSRLS